MFEKIEGERERGRKKGKGKNKEDFRRKIGEG
jgi:hypothetical protein